MSAPDSVARLQRVSIPVHAEAYEGLGDIQGVLVFDGQSVRLSFQTADALFGILKSKAQELQLALDAIEEIGYGLGWFWLLPYLELRLNDFGLLSQIPAARHGRLRLRVRFADRHLARRFVEQLRFARAEHLHRSIDGSLPSAPPLAMTPPPLPATHRVDATRSEATFAEQDGERRSEHN